ncbi:MAG TPA: dNTP triphosphohydrolase [Bryobacteraceae bacterium]|nr:dNTP triphosphohydrolase [Bryobacteraceae bacterium]
MSLRRLRQDVARGRGRRYPELPHPYRNDFQLDRDRIVLARAFRRLEDKTQVFPAGDSDHFRNRLTHTIEVAQFARTVASVLELDEDLTEALALAHDIGHPPFAHAGEDELNRQMQRFGDRFDHNFHALRIVEFFEDRYARFPGLNLTFEVREGIVKHSHDFEPGEEPELDQYLPGLRPPLEAQLIDLADEVAYDTADLDDTFAAGFFSMDEAAAAVPEFAELEAAVANQFPGAPEKVQFHEIQLALMDRLVSGLINGTAAAANQAGVETVDDVRAFPQRLACFTPETTVLAHKLKTFLAGRVYNSTRLHRERKRSTAKIARLFEHFVLHPNCLPDSFRQSAAKAPLHRVVCDYIAGMTDGYFLRCYAEQKLDHCP